MPLVRDPVRHQIRQPVRDPVRDPVLEPDQVILELVPVDFLKFQSCYLRCQA